MKKTLLVIFIFCNYLIFAQKDHIFERYTSDSGLPADYVLDICQDSQGFMWFGFRGGIYRFDGFTFKTFPLIQGNDTIRINTWVRKITIDQKGRLWISVSDFGLLLFDAENECFVEHTPYLKLPKNPYGTVIYPYPGGGETIWASVFRFGFVKYNPDTKDISYFCNTVNNNSIPEGSCNYILQLHDDEILMSFDNSIYRFNEKDNSFTFIGEFEYKVISIVVDSRNNIWANTHNSGLHKLDENGKNFRQFSFPEEREELVVYSMAEDFTGKYWIGTNNGLYVAGRTNKVLQHFNFDETDPESINSDIVRKIYIDNMSNIWLATSEGICKYKKLQFKTFQFSHKKNSLSHNKVQFIGKYAKNKLFIGTPAGIDIFHTKQMSFTPFLKNTGDENGLFYSPLCYYIEKNNDIWLGVFVKGINYYDSSLKKSILYTNKSSGTDLDSLEFVFTIIDDSADNLWFGGVGIHVFDKDRYHIASYTHIKGDTSTLPSIYIRALFEDSKKRIWAGTQNGVAYKIDGENKFNRVFDNTIIKDRREILVSQIIESKKGGCMWFATIAGLIKYDPESKELVKYSKKNGLPTSQIQSIIEDDDGLLWLGTSNGLVRFTPDYMSENKKIALKIYNRNDGIQGNEFLPSSCYKLEDGSILFGGYKGLSLFHPDSMTYDTLPPNIVFTGLEINNEKIRIGQEVNNQIVLPKSINTIEQLILNYKNNKFSIKFSALHFKNTSKSRYVYKLEGVDEKWSHTNEADRKATYMNLKGGEYMLYVKASNGDDVWTDKPLTLNIKILPPWWKTKWFFALWVCTFLGIVFLTVKVWTLGLQRQKEKLEKEVSLRTNELKDTNVVLSERTEELEQQMQEISKMNSELKDKTKQVELMAKQLHEADESKLSFFANISHEFRTPLSLILAPLENFLSMKPPINWDKINALSQIKLIYRNALRLQRLTNQVIDLRRLEHGMKKIHLSHNNIVDFISEIVNTFLSQAEAKGIHLLVKNEELRVKNEELRVKNEEFGVKSEEQSIQNPQSLLITQFWFDPDIMEKILFNLISNAIKYTPEGGEILITIGSVETRLIASLQNQLAIKISDTGIGIKPENIKKIFDRFYREPNTKSEGTGIGLAYTKELVELHNGAINVKSKVNNGTTITLLFPFDSESSHNKHIKSIYEVKHTPLDNESEELDLSFYKDNSQQPEKLGNILIVEDNNDLRKLLVNELGSHYTIFEAPDGASGLETANEKNPDLIISDVMMPNMDGFELCKRIKTNENTSHIPVVLLTARVESEDTITGFKTGADDYITKPFKMPVLKARIENILRIRKQLQEKFSDSPFNFKLKDIGAGKFDEEFLARATNIVVDNVENKDFNNDMFVSLMGHSTSLVYKKIKAFSGKSVSEFIRTIKLQIAVKYLMESDLNINEIAWKVGFKHRQNFTDQFTAAYGISPSKYKKKHS